MQQSYGWKNVKEDYIGIAGTVRYFADFEKSLKMQEQCRKRSKKIGLNSNVILLRIQPSVYFWLSRLRILWLFVRRGVYFTDTIGEN